MTCRDWHSRAKKGHFWDSDNASKFIFFEKFTFPTLRQGSSLVVARPTDMKICPVGPEEVVVQNDMSRLTFSGKKRSFLRFWQCVEIHFFWEIYISYAQTGVEFGCRATHRHENLSGRPGGSRRTEWHVAIDILGQKKVIFEILTMRRNSFFWEIYISYAQTGVEFGCRATHRHENLSCRPGGSRRTEWHVAIDILGQKKVIFEILTMRRNSFFLRNLHFLRSDRGRVWLSRDPQHENLSGRPGGSRRTEWHVAIDILGQKKVIFEILTMRRNSFFLRNLHFLRSDRGRVWLSRDRQAWKFVREARGKSSYRMTCRDWHSRAKKGHFWDSDNASKFIFFEKFTFPTLRQGSSLVVARLTSMTICPPGPEEVVVQNDMSRLTLSGKKRSFLRFWQCVEIHFFWEIYISYAQTGVEFGCRATHRHENLSGRPGGSRRTEWHVAIDILGQKKVIFEILTMRRNSFFWEIYISYAQTGVEFGCRATHRHENLSCRPGGSRRTEWHVAIDILGQKKVIFEILTMRRNSFFLRNLHFLRSDRGRVWLSRDPQTWKFVR